MNCKILLPILFLLAFIQILTAQKVDILDQNTVRLRLDSKSAELGGEIRLYDTDGTTTCILSGNHGSTQGAYMNMYQGDGSHTIQLDAHHYGGGQFYLRNSNGHLAIHAQAQEGTTSTSNDASLELFNLNGFKKIRLGASDGIFGGTNISTFGGNFDYTAFSAGTSIFGGGFFYIRDAGGNFIVRAYAQPTGEDYHFEVDGKIISEELRIADSANWPDYVFNSNYQLAELDALSEEIKDLGHLPKIPSAEEIEKTGIDTGEMLKRQMEKIEELTLYVIQLHERIKELEK